MLIGSRDYKMKKALCLVSNFMLMSLLCSMSMANENSKTEVSSRMQEVVKTHAADIFKWASSPWIIDFIKAENSKHISPDDLKKIDREWIAGNQDTLVKKLQSNKLGEFLRSKVEGNNLYVEAFACDNRGLVVGLFPRTTDYWQGDEAKFINSYENGSGRVYFSPVAYDESTKTYSIHISIPIRDWNDTVGVIIVGLKNFQ